MGLSRLKFDREDLSAEATLLNRNDVAPRRSEAFDHPPPEGVGIGACRRGVHQLAVGDSNDGPSDRTVHAGRLAAQDAVTGFKFDLKSCELNAELRRDHE